MKAALIAATGSLAVLILTGWYHITAPCRLTHHPIKIFGVEIGGCREAGR